MARDVRRSKRVAHLLKTMEQVARKNAGDANREVAELRAEHRRLIESLSGDHDLSGLFVDLLAKRANVVVQALNVKVAEQAIATGVWRQARLRSDAAQEVALEVKMDADNARAAKDLEQLIEDSQMFGSARSR